jgi:hypothetical protein
MPCAVVADAAQLALGLEWIRLGNDGSGSQEGLDLQPSQQVEVIDRLAS